MKFLIGQRVVVGNEIGQIVDQFGLDPNGNISCESGRPRTPDDMVWVYRPSKGFASCFSASGVFPLANGQI